MEKTGGSRLMQMQARYQQKQLAERELKIASLYETQQARALDRVRHSPNLTGTSNVKNVTLSEQPTKHVPMPPGKVRQMFEERRTRAGIDKSYPLQPIHNHERPTPKKIINGHSKSTTAVTNARVVEKKSRTNGNVVRKPTVTKSEKIVHGSKGDVNHNHVKHSNNHSNRHTQNGKLSATETDKLEKLEKIEKLDNLEKIEKLDHLENLIENETYPDGLEPSTPRSPEPTHPTRPPRKSTSIKSTVSSPHTPVAPPRRSTSDKTPRKKPQMQPGTSAAPIRYTIQSKVGQQSAAQGEACPVCGRRFAPDRLPTHEEICRKANHKKRKPFDALKHRLQGTEAEPFINKLRKSAPSSKPSSTSSSKTGLNNNWRKKHEDFINAIRSAKQVQAHLNAGGNLRDLPPPPPSENPDYVPCPHCGRRFNQQAAERHIPKCATYQFNKANRAKPSGSKK